jgi:hypothetical protein
MKPYSKYCHLCLKYHVGNCLNKKAKRVKKDEQITIN